MNDIKQLKIQSYPAENQLPILSGSALKVIVGGVGQPITLSIPTLRLG